MLQGPADLEKEVHSDVLLAAHLVDVLGRAMHLTRQPSGGTPLPGQLSLDEPAHVEVNILVRFLSHYECYKIRPIPFLSFHWYTNLFYKKNGIILPLFYNGLFGNADWR